MMRGAHPDFHRYASTVQPLPAGWLRGEENTGGNSLSGRRFGQRQLQQI